MRNLSLLLALAFSGTTLAHGPETPPHLDLELTSEEYAELLKQLPKKARTSTSSKASVVKAAEDPVIESTLKIGTRLLSWMNKVNSSQPSMKTVQLTVNASVASRGGGIPIEGPSTLSSTLIRDGLLKAWASCPESVRNVLVSSDELPDTLPVDAPIFAECARGIDYQYQNAARFKYLESWREYYKGRAKFDVRGYHYLKTNKITDKELEDMAQLPADKHAPLATALEGICFNAQGTTRKSCEDEVKKAMKENKVADFYRYYIFAARSVWESFFKIPEIAIRKDIVWSENEAKVPFKAPSLAQFAPYILDNIQDEFRWKGWALKLNFQTRGELPFLDFKPGVLPSVDKLGGNAITLDANTSLDELHSKLVIRHEFGHVLGLPDCYLEFYDEVTRTYINYQLDTTDLMCSRAGYMNERIYKELKRTYGK